MAVTPYRIVIAGKAPNSRWIVVGPIGNVVEFAVRRGVAKLIGYYDNIDDANVEGFTAEEIEKHVNVDLAL